MLELKNNLFEGIECDAKEHYTFQFSREEMTSVEKKYIGIMKKRMLISVALCVVLIVIGIFTDRCMLGFGIGALFISLAGHIKGISAYKKLYEKSKERCVKTLYDYTLYDGFMIVWISSEIAVRQLKVRLDEIKKSRIISGLIVMEIDGQLFLVRKDELIENSYFLSISDNK